MLEARPLACYISHKTKSTPPRKQERAKIMQKQDSALLAIPTPANRDEWLNISMAYKAAGGTFDTWDAWSAQGQGYNARANSSVWDSIDTSGGITEATLYKIAQENGWTDEERQQKRTRTTAAAPGRQAAQTRRATPETKPTPDQQKSITAYIEQAAQNRDEAAAYCNTRGLNADTVARWNIGYDKQTRRLIIPYPAAAYYVSRSTTITPNGEHGDGKKYQYPPKAQAGKKPLFNIPALNTRNAFICITEGQIDAITLEQAGLPAVAATEPETLLQAIEANGTTARAFLVIPDNDNAGQDKAAAMIEALTADNKAAYIYPIPADYHDTNDFQIRAAAELYEWTKNAALFLAEQIKAELDAYNKQSGASRLEQYERSWNEGKDIAIPTGFNSLDTLLDGGLYPGLYTVGAISSLGKTTFSLQIADYIAEHGRDVLYFALEQSGAELTAKTLSRISALVSLEQEGDYKNALTNRAITSKNKRAVWTKTSIMQTMEEAKSRYRATIGKHIFIFEGIGDIGVESIRATIDRHKKVKGTTPVIFIDYAQILAPYADRLTDKQNMDKNIVELKRISRDENIPVIAISSFNRENYNTRVDLSAFKESGAVEYTSDCVIGIQPQGIKEGDKDKMASQNRETIRNCKQSNLRDLEAVILKNRNGGLGIVKLEYRTLFNLYTDRGILQQSAKGNPEDYAKKNTTPAPASSAAPAWSNAQ